MNAKEFQRNENVKTVIEDTRSQNGLVRGDILEAVLVYDGTPENDLVRGDILEPVLVHEGTLQSIPDQEDQNDPDDI